MGKTGLPSPAKLNCAILQQFRFEFGNAFKMNRKGEIVSCFSAS